MAESNLTLVLPPFFFADDKKARFAESLTANAAALKNLRKLIGRGEHEHIDDQALALCQLFGTYFQDTADIPIATLKASGNGFDSSTGYWLCAESVHLHPDLDHVVLFDKSQFELSHNELAGLVEGLKPLFEEEKIEVWQGDDMTLYLRLLDVPKVDFTPLEKVSGNNILPFMPEGDDAAKWSQLLNEIQIQLSQNEVNEYRENTGQLTVNGLWFWGGGFLTPRKYDQEFDRVWSDNPFIRGLANFRGIKVKPSVEGFSKIDTGERTLVSVAADKLEKGEHSSALLDIENNWVTPALNAIKKGELEHLTLILGHMRVGINNKLLGRFWKRSASANDIAACL